ncbi:MAG: protein phosphatase 2C domain-containing protein, partial [Ktedonobacteraceae bacterium]|nr:protein phosphatase 2C domain-containing protein [Ktedonobacteraceae bacterium]
AIETLADILLPHIITLPRSLTKTKSETPPSQPIPIKPSSKTQSEEILEHWLRDGARQANKVIYHCNADYEINMASTLTAALLYKHRLYVASVGDSRAYHYSNDRGLTCISNQVGGTSLPGGQQATSAQVLEDRLLGVHYNVPVEVRQMAVQPGELILLCTDGLWHMVNDQRLEEMLAGGGDTQVMAHTLVEAANRAGGEGNISAIVVRVQ